MSGQLSTYFAKDPTSTDSRITVWLERDPNAPHTNASSRRRRVPLPNEDGSYNNNNNSNSNNNGNNNGYSNNGNGNNNNYPYGKEWRIVPPAVIDPTFDYDRLQELREVEEDPVSSTQFDYPAIHFLNKDFPLKLTQNLNHAG